MYLQRNHQSTWFKYFLFVWNGLIHHLVLFLLSGKAYKQVFQDCHWVLGSINEFTSSSYRWKCEVHSKNMDWRTIKDCKNISSPSKQKYESTKKIQETTTDVHYFNVFLPPVERNILYGIFMHQYTLLSCLSCFKRNNLCSMQKRNPNEVY